jgi:hypothetical protein
MRGSFFERKGCYSPASLRPSAVRHPGSSPGGCAHLLESAPTELGSVHNRRGSGGGGLGPRCVSCGGQHEGRGVRSILNIENYHKQDKTKD